MIRVVERSLKAGFYGTIVLSWVASAAGVSYEEAFQVVAQPESYSQATVLYQGIGLQLAALGLASLAVFLIMGAWYGYWEKDGYKKMMVLATLIEVLLLAGFPFLLMV